MSVLMASLTAAVSALSKICGEVLGVTPAAAAAALAASSAVAI